MFCLTLVVAGQRDDPQPDVGRHPGPGRAPRPAGCPRPSTRRGSSGAVEECLRWVTPIQAFCRTVDADTEVGGTPVSAGDYLVMLYASGQPRRVRVRPDGRTTST